MPGTACWTPVPFGNDGAVLVTNGLRCSVGLTEADLVRGTSRQRWEIASREAAGT